jgi:hypothetical protein
MIFGNMEDLHAFHQDLSSRIDICVEHTPHMIGDVFVLMGLERTIDPARPLFTYSPLAFFSLFLLQL